MRFQHRPARDNPAIGNLHVTTERSILGNALSHLLGTSPKPALDCREFLARLDNRGTELPLRRCRVG
jgi:hypothetical protein